MKAGVKQVLVALCGAFFCNFTITLAQTSQAQPSLAVLSLRAENDTLKDEAAKLTAQLHAEFERLQLFTCLPPGEETRMPYTFDLRAENERSAALAAGRALQAKVVAFGRLQKNGQAYGIAIYLVHVASGQIVEQVHEDFFGDFIDLAHHLPALVKKLIGMTAQEAGAAGFAEIFEGSSVARETRSSS